MRYRSGRLATAEMPSLLTDGDMMLQLELADDDISSIRKALKAILRNGKVTPEEAERMKISAGTPRVIADKFMIASSYLDERKCSK